VIQTPQNDITKKKDNEGLLLSDELMEALAKFQTIELEDFQMDVKDFEIIFEAGMAGQIMPKLKLPTSIAGGKPLSMLQAAFLPPIETYPNKIAEVKLGATKKRRRHTREITHHRRRSISRFLHF
jgi:CO dehydrogenase/acetyl-CoA synthase delta subunit